SIAQKATKDGKNINIVVSPDVAGLVSVSLENVDWFTALEAVIRPYNYTYEWVGNNIILVDTSEKIRERESQEKERQEVEPPKTKVYHLKYIDAGDAKKTIEPILSPIGRISILEITGQAGWTFGSDVTKRERAKEEKTSRTKVMVVSDVAKKLDEIDALLEKVDIMPKQVMIRTRIMEVNRDLLDDFGIDWGTGTTGADSSSSFVYTPYTKDSEAGIDLAQVAAHAIAPTPSGFGAKTTALTDNSFKLIYKKLLGNQFEVIVHALEEDARTNTLSAPTILTLNNQEASILVGQKYPIIKTETSAETSQITGGSLDYYQDIGIQLNVVPQICGENEDYISMIIHPAITSRLSDVTVKDQAGTTLVSYPWLTSREAETQVVTKDGETIVIGGLLKDVKTEHDIGIPFLSRIPLFGWLFKRQTKDIEKIDLLIFITAKIVEPGRLMGDEFIKDSKVFSEFKLKDTDKKKSKKTKKKK
ncbi:MAG: hypothetical protein KKH93_00295, partial [Candidatus Omnitrophica bacterium]|nr:hypothetical protein [Candidatus Omnitrophota bacterium]